MMTMEDEGDPVAVVVEGAAAMPATASPQDDDPTGRGSSTMHVPQRQPQPNECQHQLDDHGATMGNMEAAAETHPTDGGDAQSSPTSSAPTAARTITPTPPASSVFRGSASEPAGAGLCLEYAPTAPAENHEYYWGAAAAGGDSSTASPAEFCTGSASPPGPEMAGHHHHHHRGPRRRRFYSSPSSCSAGRGGPRHRPQQSQQQESQSQRQLQLQLGGGDEQQLVWGSLSFDDAAATVAARWNNSGSAPPRFDAAASQRPRRRRRTEADGGGGEVVVIGAQTPADRRPSSLASGGVDDEGATSPPPSPLRSSLDAGMAALRRRAEGLFGKRGGVGGVGGGGDDDDGSGADDDGDDFGGDFEFGDYHYHASGLSPLGTTSSLRLRRRHLHMGAGPHRQRSARAMLMVPPSSASEDAMDVGLGFDGSAAVGVRNRDQRAYSEPNGAGIFRNVSWGDNPPPLTPHRPLDESSSTARRGDCDLAPSPPPPTSACVPPRDAAAAVVAAEEMTGSAPPPPPPPPTGDVGDAAANDDVEGSASAGRGGGGFDVVVDDEPSVASAASAHASAAAAPGAAARAAADGGDDDDDDDGGGAAAEGVEQVEEDEEDEEEQRRRVQEEQEEEQRRRQRQQQQWIRINHYFQCLITLVALMFSMILFAILVCWVVLTSAYVVSIDKVCDVPLKRYYWFATLQLILDVFRTDIMKHVFRWDPNSRQQQRIPSRVIVYNLAYISFAIIVLKTGIESVFASQGATCSKTAPELFQTSKVFVSLSILAWSTIVIGYIIPFCFLAILLTRSGYSTRGAGAQFFNAGDGAGVTPGAGFRSMFNNREGADPRCIDQLRVVLLEEFPDHYPKECCICMGDFAAGEVIVVTQCEHVFHKSCCREWLRQARTCPVCRTDIPTALGLDGDVEDTETATANADRDAGVPSNDGDVNATELRVGSPAVQEEEQRRRLGGDEFNREVANLLRILRQHEERLRQEQALHDPSIEGADDRTIVLSRDSGPSSGAVSLGSDTSNTSRRDSRQNSTIIVEAAEEGRMF